jgi:tRNA uridine 5-carboxymethylaminomethyl modification enzyme
MHVSIVVIGGGHAGCEAAAAASKMGVDTLLVTTDPESLCRMSCNPAIGGIGKGHLVREIDALGGLMGRIADTAAIQYKVLNRRKGPAVWGLRAQEDRRLYGEAARAIMGEVPGLNIVKGTALGVVVESGVAQGVIVKEIGEVKADAVIVAAGTFLGGTIHTGNEIVPGGRKGEPPAAGITESLVDAGLKAGRFKTGTPPRVDGETIDRTGLREEWGDKDPIPFSNFGQPSSLPRRACWLTGTSERTHAVIKNNINSAPMYSGQIKAVGPRSCPSIEDKVMRFPDRASHQIYLEPEGLETEELYLNGLATSFSRELQRDLVASIPGLGDAKITKYGYAIEYDYFPPQQLFATLEAKEIKGLYLAGQINGTTGYEEAGSQGLIAGINAALSVKGHPALVLPRAEAYIGVMIDDLVLKGVEYPYRIYTSRAEARLFLRNDNADMRLSKAGRRMGLLGNKDYDRVLAKEKGIEDLLALLKNTRLNKDQLTAAFSRKGESFRRSETLLAVLRRPPIGIKDIIASCLNDPVTSFSDEAMREVELSVKYEGYIKRGEAEVEKLKKLDGLRIPDTLDYRSIQNISAFGRERLVEIKPKTLGQASRIPGITRNDISVLAVILGKMRRQGTQ